jgi:hypothetical protein
VCALQPELTVVLADRAAQMTAEQAVELALGQLGNPRQGRARQGVFE